MKSYVKPQSDFRSAVRWFLFLFSAQLALAASLFIAAAIIV